jgi:alkylation response protein AidB-like acyl-CoA dehydrogenase
MNFDFSDDQREIKRTARELLARHSSLAQVRHAAERGAYDPVLWNQLCALGWPGIAIAEEYSGEGLGTVELAIVLEEAGYAVAASPLLSTTMAALVLQEAGSDEQRREWLPRLARGDAVGALGLGTDGHAELVPDAPDADVIVMVDEDGAWLIEAANADVEATETIDPTRRYGSVRGDGPALPGSPLPGVERATVAVAAELIGLCQRVLEMTVEYVKDRKQFDTPVGAFQGVSHRCAEMLLHTEGSRSATYYGAWAADADPESLPEAAAVAKVAAGEAGREVTAAAIQAHGGIGFTWEADVHWFYKRAQLDAVLLGSARTHRARISQIVAGRLSKAVA